MHFSLIPPLLFPLYFLHILFLFLFVSLSPCRQLRTGDVFAVPRGWTAWLWNNQTDRPFSAVAVIDTSLAPSAGPSRVNLFRLMGAQKEGLGGILHGFR